MRMQASERLYAFLEELEERRHKAYFCPAGKLTIGVGHVFTGMERATGGIKIGGKTVSREKGLSDAQIDALLRQDVAWAVNTVNEAVQVELTQGQFDALVSFCFNVGRGAFAGSTLLRKLNDEEYEAVPVELAKWVFGTVKGKKRKMKGLEIRRKKEIGLWKESEGKA